jgi:hypothetical protein
MVVKRRQPDTFISSSTSQFKRNRYINLAAYVGRSAGDVEDENVLFAVKGNPSISTHWIASRNGILQVQHGVSSTKLKWTPIIYSLYKGYRQGTTIVVWKFFLCYCLKSWMNLTFLTEYCGRMRKDPLEVAQQVFTICTNWHTECTCRMTVAIATQI